MAFGSVNVPGKLTAADVGAAATGHTHTAADVGAVPTSRKVNGKPLSADITLTATDVGAIGKSLAGQSVSPVKDQTVTAGEGAEIFNDYRVRTYNSLGSAEQGNVASGRRAHAEGTNTTASGDYSHTEGAGTTASGDYSHTEGAGTTASGDYSHAEGRLSGSLGDYSHAEGDQTRAEGRASHAEGGSNAARGDNSHAEGKGTIASNYASHVGGKLNKAMTDGGAEDNTTGDVFILGNGTGYAARSNCFRVTYAGAVYGKSAFNSTGADYAEFFEWADANPKAEDRVGLFVTLEGKQIKIANPGDYALGVVSGQPCIIGNADEDWLGRWEHDDFGRFVKEYLEDEETEIAAEGLTEDEIDALCRDPEVREKDGKLYRVTAKVVDHKTPSWRYKANPAYDNTQPYIERKDRPEWSAVGMLGVLSVRDDGTCQVNGFCRVADGGTATAAEAELSIEGGQIRKAYRVLERVSENVVRIVFR